jgi:ADP-heptose:LPS heptosyltransferase
MVGTNDWDFDPVPDYRVFKTISPTKLRELGIDIKEPIVDTLEQLQQQPPGIIIAKCILSVTFMQNFFKQQTLKRKQSYVLGLGTYKQLHYNVKTKQQILKPTQIKFRNLYHPYRGQDLSGKVLLVSRTGGIGDLLFIQPNLKYLKQKYPSCYIKFACGPQYQSMVETWTDCVDEVLDLPYSLNELQTSSYQAIFEGVIERCNQSHKENAYHLFTKWLNLNLPDDLLIPKQKPKQALIEQCKSVIEKWGIKDFILVQARASSPIRTPDPKVWIKLINKLTNKGYNVVFTDTKKESPHYTKLIETCENQNQLFNFCSYSESLDMTIALTSLSKLVLAIDSALVHIAASIGIPVYGLYGPFPGRVRLSLYPKTKWVDAESPCAPCFLHGYESCPTAKQQRVKFSPCYNNIDLDKVVTEVESLIS